MKKIILFLLLFFYGTIGVLSFDISGMTLSNNINNIRYTGIDSIKASSLSPSGNKIYLIEFDNGVGSYLAQYSLPTPFSGTGATSRTIYNLTNQYGSAFGFYNNGYILVTKGDFLNYTVFNLSNPYDISSRVLWYSVASFTAKGFFDFSSDGLLFFGSGEGTIDKWILSTPFDLRTKVYNSSISVLSSIGNNIRGVEYVDLDNTFIVGYGTSLYNVNNSGTVLSSYNLGFSADTDINLDSNFLSVSNGYNNYFYETPLSAMKFINTGSLVPINNGFSLSGTILNKNFYISDVEYLKYEQGGILLLDSYSYTGNKTYSGNINNNINFTNTGTFTFTTLNDYEIFVKFKSLDGIESIQQYYTYGNYQYNQGYIDPATIIYNFTVGGLEFFPNGFGLRNFIPSPSGGKLYFEIIAPNSNGTGTVNIVTNIFLPYDIDGKGYGFDSLVNVTFPYHQTVGNYQVRVVYDYQGYKIYPFGTGYNSYTITNPELPVNTDDIDGFIIDGSGNIVPAPKYNPFITKASCDKNSDGEISFLFELPGCIVDGIENIFNKAYKGVLSFLQLIKELMNIGQGVEYKSLSLIPKANASVSSDILPTAGSESTILTKIYNMYKYGLYLMMLLIVLSFYISNKKE